MKILITLFTLALVIFNSCITINEGRETISFTIDKETKELYDMSKEFCVHELRSMVVNHPKGNIVYQIRMLEYEISNDSIACPVK